MVKGLQLSISLPHHKLEQLLRDMIVEQHPAEADKHMVMSFTTRFVGGAREVDLHIDMLDDEQYEAHQKEQAILKANGGKSRSKQKSTPVSIVSDFED